MTCSNCVEMIDALVDGELAPAEIEEVRAHLRDCSSCAAAEAQTIELSRRLRTTLMRYHAPDVLRARIRASVAHAADDTPAITPTSRRGAGWLRVTAAAIIAAAAGSGITALMFHRVGGGDVIEHDLIASHIRSLMPGHLTDIASTDQHNVKPWFNGKVNFSPPVPRLDSAGYPLVGGRLDYIDGHPVASVVYGRRQHVINVFSWPVHAADAPPALARTTNGYHVVTERRDDLALWFVSDLNAVELEQFAERFNATASALSPP